MHNLAFRQFYPAYLANDIDPAFPLMNEIFRRYELSHEQKLWVAFIYTCFYNIASTFFFMQEFPDYEKADLSRIGRWYRALTPLQQRKIFQKDRKYHALPDKYNPGKYQFETLMSSYFETLRHPAPQADYLSGVQTFAEAFKRICAVEQVGRHKGLAYVETLVRCCGYKLTMPNYSTIADKHCNKGLALAGVIPEQLIAEGIDPMYVETIGCAFRKLVEGKMYLGFYLDRQADEIKEVSSWPIANGVHWETLWQMREEIFNPAYLSRNGVDEYKLTHYRRTGEVLVPGGVLL